MIVDGLTSISQVSVFRYRTRFNDAREEICDVGRRGTSELVENVRNLLDEHRRVPQKTIN